MCGLAATKVGFTSSSSFFPLLSFFPSFPFPFYHPSSLPHTVPPDFSSPSIVPFVHSRNATKQVLNPFASKVRDVV
jgi:hypothetical protein